MENIIREIEDYAMKNEIGIEDMEYLFTDLKLETYKHMVGKNDYYVFKRGGYIQKFDYDKIERSIINSGKSAGIELTSSDLKIAQTLIEDKIKDSGENIIKSSDIRLYVVNSLKKTGFNKVVAAYQDIHYTK